MVYKQYKITIILLMIIWESSVKAETSQLCKTPKNTVGRCMPIKECTAAMEAVNRILEFMDNNQTLATEIRNDLMKAQCPHEPSVVYICCEYINNLSSKPGWNAVYNQECGQSAIDRVAFGENAKLKEFPWVAQLGYSSTEDKKIYQCGGSLITNRYVLTAAHCISRDLVSVRLGEHNTSTNPDCQKRGPRVECVPPVEDFSIEKTIVHPEYSKPLLTHDVALLRLASDVSFKVHIAPICLPITELSIEVPEKIQYFVAGWGKFETEEVPEILQKAIVPYVERGKCEEVFNRNFSNTVLCAGGIKADACKGDSGGPLFYPRSYKTNVPRFIQYGVVSAGVRVCGPDDAIPGIYTDVIEVLPWILQNIN